MQIFRFWIRRWAVRTNDTKQCRKNIRDRTASNSTNERLGAFVFTYLVEQVFGGVLDTALPTGHIRLEFFDQTSVKQHSWFSWQGIQDGLIGGSDSHANASEHTLTHRCVLSVIEKSGTGQLPKVSIQLHWPKA
jgi:hypothetical protein